MRSHQAPGWDAEDLIYMTEQTDKTRSQPVEDVAAQAGSAAPAGISRRDVLRGATVAVPTILTLHSGTALAVASTSSKVSASATPGRVGDNYVCLDTTGQVGPAYDVTNGARAKAVPVVYEYVSTDDLLGVDLTKPSEITEAIRVKRIRPLRADELCRSRATNYVPVVKKGPKKYEPVQRDGGVFIARMPSAANLSAIAYNSTSASGKLSTQFLV